LGVIFGYRLTSLGLSMSKKRGFTLVEGTFAFAAVALLAAVLLPALQAARFKAQKNTSAHNLKAIGIAIQNYHDVFGRLPTGGWVFNGKERFGWPTAILPFVDQAPLYLKIDDHVSWLAPVNQPHARVSIPDYLIPGSTPVATPDGFAMCHYAGNASVLHRNSSLKMAQITNGAANTLLIGETKGEFRPWGGSWNWRPVEAPLGGAESFGSQASADTMFVMVDGKVKTLSKEIDAAVLQKLASSGYTPRAEDLVRPAIPEKYGLGK